MQIITKPYRNSGPLNKLVVSLNNAIKSDSILSGIYDTGRSPHVLVDELGNVEVLSEPASAVVPFQGQNLLSPHAESPAVWVEFTGTGPDDIAHIDVIQILQDLCGQFNVSFEFAQTSPNLCGKGFTATSGIVQRKSLMGHSNATLLPLPKIRFTPAPEEVEVAGAEDLESPLEWPEFTGRSIKFGSKSAKILLIAEAYDVDTVEYDEAIEQIVISAQEEAGLNIDGVIDAATWEALNPNT